MVTRSSSWLCALALGLAPATARAAEPPKAPSAAFSAPSAPANTPKSAPARNDASETRSPAPSAVAPNAAPPAPAAASPAEAPLRGELSHAPVSFARIGDSILVRASIEHPELVRRAVLVYRATDGRLVEVPFERAPNGPYVALVPGDQVRPPSLGYTIELEDESGNRQSVFATRAAMHHVQVAEERADVQEDALLSRIDGRRSLFTLVGDYVSFGESSASIQGSPTPLTVTDHYYRGEAKYTYRLLRTVSEFGIRVGLVRGQSPVPDAKSPSDLDVGLNYGAPRVQFRLTDLFHLDAEILASLTEEGMSFGGAGALHVGDVFGSQLVVGFEAIRVFGVSAYSRLDVAAARRLTLSAIVEGTNTPHAGPNRFGVRLLGEVGVDLGSGFRIAGRGGYQARDSASGGPSVGLVGSFAF